jgi:hypothetical protein
VLPRNPSQKASAMSLNQAACCESGTTSIVGLALSWTNRAFLRPRRASFLASDRSFFDARRSVGAVVFKCLMCVGCSIGVNDFGLVVGMSHGVTRLGTLSSRSVSLGPSAVLDCYKELLSAKTIATRTTTYIQNNYRKILEPDGIR